MSRKNCEKCNGTGTVWHWGEIKGADSDSPCPDCSWGVWNVTLKCWLLGPAMSSRGAEGGWRVERPRGRPTQRPRPTQHVRGEAGERMMWARRNRTMVTPRDQEKR